MASIENALIVGAGLGGLAAAAALSQHGISTDIVELRSHSDVLGVGINQPGNALRALRKLGVLDEVLNVGFEFDLYRFYDYKENLIVDVPSVIGGDDVPSNVAMTRRDLHNILIGAGEREGIKVRYGTTVRQLVDHGDRVDVRFSDGRNGTYHLVIGFDGIKSELRRQLFGPAYEPVYSGYAVWRVKIPRPNHVRHAAMYSGINVKAGYVPLNSEEMYLLVVTPESNDVRYAKDELADLLRDKLADFQGVVADIRNALGAGDDIAFGLLTEVLLPTPWHKGRVIVLGDAAHACLPNMAQGAGMAIEDAVILAEEIAQDRELGASLEAFTARRAPRVKFVQDVSRAVLHGEMQVTSEESLARAAAEMRAELPGRTAGADNFLKQPA